MGRPPPRAIVTAPGVKATAFSIVGRPPHVAHCPNQAFFLVSDQRGSTDPMDREAPASRNGLHGRECAGEDREREEVGEGCRGCRGRSRLACATPATEMAKNRAGSRFSRSVGHGDADHRGSMPPSRIRPQPPNAVDAI
ncbi:hypothetical protein TIFTF001_026811 [Ficus carica]|uniref:Uncharacterized protein n=1 Tax=Ficus carica TaxID=3494 RepID=A0AA88DM61_FICCA|nr:hypothetical protein TIFTF001_026811 [Ficus carica]